MVNYRVKGDYYVVDRLVQRRDSGLRRGPRAGPRDHRLCGRGEVTAMAETVQRATDQDAGTEQEEEHEHSGGGRFNRLLSTLLRPWR